MLKSKMLTYCLLLSLFSFAQEYDYSYSFFSNSIMPGDYYFSKIENKGGSFLYNKDFKVPVNPTIFHTAGNSLQLVYINAKGGHWQATIYHQQKRGVDHFKKAAFLSFWIFNTKVDSTNNGLPVVQLLRSDSTLSEKYRLTTMQENVWERIIIPTSAFKNVDPSKPAKIIGIVFSQQNKKVNKKHSIYIDDIEFIPETNAAFVAATPVIKSAKGYAMHVDLTWDKPLDKNIKLVNIYRSSNGIDYRDVGVQQSYINRYADFTGETGKKFYYKISFLNNNYLETKSSAVVQAETKEMSDDELLTMVQEASFRYYWENAESKSGLAKESIPGRKNMIATGASGFGIMALIVGAERKFISREECVKRFESIVNFLDRAQTFHGVFPHFIDGNTGKAEAFFGKRDNGADLVETSFLLQGLLTARQYFSANNRQEKLIRDKITSIWKKAEWNWFRQSANSKFLYWHWSPDQKWAINHKLIGFNETMVTYLLAIASTTHPIPASMYYSGWANQDTVGQNYRMAWGQTKEGSMYTNGNVYFGQKLDVGVSSGGPLFFTHYSYMGYDPHLITDNYTNYFRNNQKIANINHKYCVQNPNDHVGYSDSAWGLTASDGPSNYSADEPVATKDHGKLTPTGAISSFPYTAEESMKALKNYYFKYGSFLWGEYGFKDAFDLTHNWCSEIYMGLNQAPMTVMIENYRTGLIWKLFMSDPEIKAGLEKLQLETNNMINSRGIE